MSATPSVARENVTVGDQAVEWANVQIRIEDAAVERRIRQERHEHDLREESKDNTFRRWREMITFAVVIIVVVGVFVGSVSVALTTDDPIKQTFAQGFATTLAGAIGGAFAGYAVAERKK
jgi:hypothetical protein